MVVTGKFSGKSYFGGLSLTSRGDIDIFIVEYNSSGSEQWVKKAGGTGYDVGYEIDTDQFNNCYITGRFDNKAYFGSNTVNSAGKQDFFISKLEYQSETVTTPTYLSGPSSVKVGQLVYFNTGGSNSNMGHAVEYQFDWGDGNYSSWGSANRSHSYSSSGNFNIKAQARCKTHTNVISSWSSRKSVAISYCQLDITINPSGSGSVNKNPDKSNYTYNENVQLTAQPNNNYKFDHWGGDLSGTSKQKTLNMNGDKNVTAYFMETEQITKPNRPSGPSSGKVAQSISFTTGGSTSNSCQNIEYQFDWGDGNISSWGSSDRSHSYAETGEFCVKVRAGCITDSSIVSEWSDPKCVSISYCNLTINIEPEGTGTVSKSPDKGGYAYDENVQLSANADSGYIFDHWEGDLSGNDNFENILMNGDKNIIAHFSEGQISPVHFITFAENTGDNYSIIIDAATINNNPIEIEDEIGVFTPDSLCVGASVWTGNTPLALVAWVDNSQTNVIDGYIKGDVMNFRIWDKSENKEFPTIANYSYGDSTFEGSLYSHIYLLV